MNARTLLLSIAVVGCRQQARGPDTAGVTAQSPPSPAAAVPRADSVAASAARRGAGEPLGAKGPATPAPVKTTKIQPASEDTLRGVPAVVGTDRFNQVVLKPAGGGKGTVLTGPQARLIGNASGADVWVAGTRQPNGDLLVTRFVVRSVDGTAALDGTLEATGNQYYLVTADGTRHTVNNVPQALREHVGERVWITGAPEKGPVSFGIIGKVQ